MKKSYEPISATIVVFDEEDFIRTSADTGTGANLYIDPYDNDGDWPSSWGT